MPGFTLLKSSSISHKLEKLLGRKVDVMSERHLRVWIRGRVVEEVVPL